MTPESRPKSRAAGMSAKRKKPFESQQNEGAQMSNELESDRTMVANLEILEPTRMPLSGVGPLVCDSDRDRVDRRRGRQLEVQSSTVTSTVTSTSTNPGPAVKIMFQVTR
jgi:hypothetical protein